MIEENLQDFSTHPPSNSVSQLKKVEPEFNPSIYEELKAVIWDGPLNLLILAFPIAWGSYLASGPDLLTFIFALLALAPLAERLGFITEQLAFHTNDTIGGLLNATFGNATELIVAITALNRGLYRLVQLSLLGSILSNMLLVLGTAFFCGGLRYREQTYSKLPAQMNSTLLLLATSAVLFPTALSMSQQESATAEKNFSRIGSLILLAAYAGLIYFQLVSHKHLYDAVGNSDVFHVDSRFDRSQDYNVVSRNEEHDDDDGAFSTSLAESTHGPQVKSTIGFGNRDEGERSLGMVKPVEISSSIEKNDSANDDDDDDDGPVMRYQHAIIWLGIITVLIAILSECLSATIENAAESANISGVFISAIVLPIVGNAAEHAGAVMFAMKGKLDLSLGVAIGSSTQIALCVLPLLVILGWMMDKDLTLDFGSYEAMTMLMSVIAVTMAVKDGTSNYLLGLILIGSYVIVAIGFIAHRNIPLSS